MLLPAAFSWHEKYSGTVRLALKYWRAKMRYCNGVPTQSENSMTVNGASKEVRSLSTYSRWGIATNIGAHMEKNSLYFATVSIKHTRAVMKAKVYVE